MQLLDYDGVQLGSISQVTPFPSLYGARVAGGDIDAGDVEEVVAAPGPDPAAPCRVRSYEWDPVIGYNPDGPALDPIGPDDFVAFPGAYGASIAIGTFE